MFLERKEKIVNVVVPRGPECPWDRNGGILEHGGQHIAVPPLLNHLTDILSITHSLGPCKMKYSDPSRPPLASLPSAVSSLHFLFIDRKHFPFCWCQEACFRPQPVIVRNGTWPVVPLCSPFSSQSFCWAAGNDCGSPIDCMSPSSNYSRLQDFCQGCMLKNLNYPLGFKCNMVLKMTVECFP